MKQRNYGIDALRIVSMFMVVTLHVLGKSDLLYNKNLDIASVKYIIVWTIEIGAFCAVNCYALITGYIGINSRTKYSNIIYLWLQVVYYSLGIYLLFSVLGVVEFNISQCLKFLLPVANAKYWYFTAYFALFFMMPILNTAINNMSKIKLKIVIITMFFVFSILPILQVEDIFRIYRGYHFVWLMYLYIVGAYINKHGAKSIITGINPILLYILMILITFVAKLYGDFLVNIKGEDWKFTLLEYTSPTILISGIALLVLFSKLKFNDFSGKIITFIGKLCFSIYLIHEHEIISEKYIINRFSYLINYDSFNLIFRIFFSVLVICIICLSIDMLRLIIFKAFFIRKILSKIDNKLIKL